MSPCGCKKQKTPEPLRPATSIKLTESQNRATVDPNKTLTPQEADLLKKINDKLKG